MPADSPINPVVVSREGFEHQLVTHARSCPDGKPEIRQCTCGAETDAVFCMSCEELIFMVSHASDPCPCATELLGLLTNRERA